MRTLFAWNGINTEYVSIALYGLLGGFISLNTKIDKLRFSIDEDNKTYIMVAVSKAIFLLYQA